MVLYIYVLSCTYVVIPIFLVGVSIMIVQTRYSQTGIIASGSLVFSLSNTGWAKVLSISASSR